MAFAIPFTVGIVLLYFSPESPKYLNATGQQEKALEVVKLIYAVNNRASKDEFEVSIKINKFYEN